jgi:AcrR family transcriptional regulator
MQAMKSSGPKSAAGSVEDAKPPRAQKSHRKPVRQRGKAKFNILLDATEALLLEYSTDEIGLYQIAERAGTSPASVYHFFPHKNAAFLALATRYQEAFREILARPIDPDQIKQWQDLKAIIMDRSVEYFNRNPAAQKLYLGSGSNWEIRQKDLQWNMTGAEELVRLYDSYFVMPPMKDLARRFAISVSITDSVWALSSALHGYITEEYAQESLRAGIAYYRTFLPEYIERRR